MGHVSCRDLAGAKTAKACSVQPCFSSPICSRLGVKASIGSVSCLLSQPSLSELGYEMEGLSGWSSILC